MENYAIKFKFKTAVHFGDLSQTPDDSNGDFVLQNDSIFSALVIEAKNLFGQRGVDKIYNLCNEKIRFSSMMPFSEELFFIPKPELFFLRSNEIEIVNYEKKLKKIKFIPSSYLEKYLKKSKIEVSTIDKLVEMQSIFGKSSVEQKLVINRDLSKDNMPFSFCTFTFNKNCGTYILVSCEPEDLNFLSGILVSLSFTGLGGKRSSGYGKFDFEIINLKNTQNQDLKCLNAYINGDYKRYMTLSVCLPQLLTDDILENSYYTFIRRSGFIDSETYSDGIMKKKDIYAFAPGSTFTQKFDGEIKDVASKCGTHPVYKNLKPFFVGVE